MREFSNNYYGLKRTALIFSVVTLLFCARGAHVGDLNVAGITLSGLSLHLLVFSVVAAAFYYTALFAMAAYVEGKTNFVSQENNEQELARILSQALDRLLLATQELQPTLQSYAARFESERLTGRLKEVDDIVASGKIEVRLNEVAVPVIGSARLSPSFFNLISGLVHNVGQRLPASRALGLEQIRIDALAALKDDFPGLVEAGTRRAVQEQWTQRRVLLEEGINEMRTFAGEFKYAVSRHEANLNAYRHPLDGALFEINVLRSVRSFKFWVLEVGVVSLLFLIALAHYIGQYWAILPSPIG